MSDTTATRPDPHSYFDNSQPRTTHMQIRLTASNASFQEQVLPGGVVITFDKGGEVDLDTRDLTILSVYRPDGREIDYVLSEPDPLLGTKLTFTVPDDDPIVEIDYTTSPTATGLMARPEQTADKTHPFLYNQSECLNARSCVPCQDSPGVRFTYDGTLIVPKELRGLMAATFVSRHVRGDVAVETWVMKKPIPAYLIGFAVGDLVSCDLSERIRVWAEPSVINAATWEFEEVPRIMEKAEGLFGPYPWDRYDMLIMPPAFPYGGMENQGLTFLSPSVLAGDRSMLSVVAHEMAHSWTGNLITNATWNDFWLNEGLTTWAEGRIDEEVAGLAIANLDRAIMDADLHRDIRRFNESGKSQLTRLAWDLTGMDPDEAFSRVPYGKGSQFIAALERSVGRDEFDAFMRKYIAAFAFKSITTEQFLDLVYLERPGLLESVDYSAWVYGEGMPSSAPRITSPLIDEVAVFADARKVPAVHQTRQWHPLQWAIYLERFPRPALPEHFKALDRRFKLGEKGNMDIRYNLALLAAESGYKDGLPQIEALLAATGRTRYLRPTYRALATQGGALKEFAYATFYRLREAYHPIAQKVIEKDFAEAE